MRVTRRRTCILDDNILYQQQSLMRTFECINPQNNSQQLTGINRIWILFEHRRFKFRRTDCFLWCRSTLLLGQLLLLLLLSFFRCSAQRMTVLFNSACRHTGRANLIGMCSPNYHRSIIICLILTGVVDLGAVSIGVLFCFSGECVDHVHPGRLRNSWKSVTLFLQHVLWIYNVHRRMNEC
jgi:hypothetical protein